MKVLATIIRGLMLLFLSLLFLNISFAQTNISGIINAYAAVSAVDYSTNAMTVSSTSDFQVGDEVLIIQMQGASISSSNNATFGNVLNYQGAGNYELATICQANGNTLSFENELIYQDYQVAGKIQIVRIPGYTDATVNATLTGRPWDGNLGGVLALRVEDTLRLNASLNMDGKGFRGGVFENSSSNTCAMNTNRSDYAYNSVDMGGHKGEGIATFINGSEYGRGAQANGGGGGNDHNSGGGGGSNASSGGLGGENQDPNLANCKGFNSGIGGKALNTQNRLFLGGGGGAGHGNNAHGSRGGHGGGIILLIANTVVSSTGTSITSMGNTAPNSSSDGAGGGGAGGSIHMDVNNFSGPLNIQVEGGKGGSADNEFLNQCFGPGGGGAGGLILTNASFSSQVNTFMQGGDNGHSINTTNFTCTANSSVGAQKGGNGQIIVNLLPEGTIPSVSCQVLPVEWLSFKASPQSGEVRLSWVLGNELNNAGFTIERSNDGLAFQAIGQIASRGDNTGLSEYQWTDSSPTPGLSLYRIRQTDLGGQQSYSEILNVSLDEAFSIQIFPNPARQQDYLQTKVYMPEAGSMDVHILNSVGQQVFQKEENLPAGTHTFGLPMHSLPAGTYFIKIINKGQVITQKLVWLG